MKTPQIKLSKLGIALLIASALLCPPPSIANDSAASTGAGGIILKREPRISMEKERLFLSEKKVVVEYEFLNESDQDIATEVAFPIPPYQFQFDDPGGPRGFDDFRVWVDGKQLEYKSDIHAVAKGVDQTELLRAAGIDINSFAKFDYSAASADPNADASQITALSETEQKKLAVVGLVDQSGFPAWTIQKTYYWTQNFPAHAIVHVRHEYRPVIGFNSMESIDLDPGVRLKKIQQARQRAASSAEYISYLERLSKVIEGSCVEPSLQKRIADEATRAYGSADPAQQGEITEMAWVDYILTTGNSWKMPIRDFQLIIERTELQPTQKQYVSFCWDGKVERPDTNHFKVRVRDFIPSKELHVAFLNIMVPSRTNQK